MYTKIRGRFSSSHPCVHQTQTMNRNKTHSTTFILCLLKSGDKILLYFAHLRKWHRLLRYVHQTKVCSNNFPESSDSTGNQKLMNSAQDWSKLWVFIQEKMQRELLEQPRAPKLHLVFDFSEIFFFHQWRSNHEICTSLLGYDLIFSVCLVATCGKILF